MNNQVSISVLVPVYNCANYINEAIDSILQQTFTDFELLIIDDKSTDATADLIQKYTDNRIVFIQKPQNSGYTNSLNQGIKLAKGKYIARMDGDDIAYSNRLEKQFFFLENNPSYVMCGTSFNEIGSDLPNIRPKDNEAIKIALLNGNCILHPSVMLRKSVLIDNQIIYDTTKEPAEDYAMWVQLLQYGKLHNLEEVLMQYRVHQLQISQTKSKLQAEIADKIRLSIFDYLNLQFTENESQVLLQFLKKKIKVDLSTLKIYKSLTNRIVLKNEAINFFDNKALIAFFETIENQVIKNNFVNETTLNPKDYFRYYKIKNKVATKLTGQQEAKLFIKSFVFFTNNKNNSSV